MKKFKKPWFLLGLLPFVFMVAAFQLAPILAMLTGSVSSSGTGGFTLDNFVKIFQSKFYLKAIQNSLLISVFSSVIGLLIGLAAAYAITRFSPRIRNALLMLSNMTSNFAGVPLAFAYIILLGSNGVFTLLFKQWGWSVFAEFNLYSWSGLVLVYVYFQIPLALLLLYPSFYAISEQWREAASLLGATKAQFWQSVGLPILTPAIFGTLGILFANAMGAYATAYALVGGNFNLLAVRIGSLVAGDVVNDPELGSALAVVMAASTLLAVYLNHKMTRRAGRFRPGQDMGKPASRRFSHWKSAVAKEEA
ncbi:ABC transporter permease [Paenibacillus sp. CAU 1782]